MDKTLGRALWRLLHAYAREFPAEPSPADRDRAAAWLAEWSAIVREHRGCRCAADWGSILADLPPDLSSADAFWAWTVDVHNLVNRKLHKRFWTPSSDPFHPES